MGLRAKLSLALIAVLAPGFAIAGIFALQHSRARLVAEVEVRGHALLTAMTAPCAIALAQGQFEALDSYIGQVSDPVRSRELELEFVMVLDEGGRVVSHTDPTAYGTRPSDPFYRAAVAAPEPVSRRVQAGNGPLLLEMSLPIVSGPRWGTLVAGFSLKRLERNLAEERWLIVLATTLFALLSWLALSAVLTRSILGRVRRLARAAAVFGSGDLESRAALSGHDELAQLGSEFDQMADQLASYTHDLEAKVAERAKEIVSANAKLEQLNAELSRAVEQLEQLAITDGLTGLFNHRYFQETLAFEMRRSARSEHPLSAVMIDVDHFKAYNDRNGHPAGDVVLRRLAEIFREHLRSLDVVARYGGEEFAFLLLDTDTEGAHVAAEKIRAAVEAEPFANQASQPTGNVTISLGVASFPDHGDSPDTVLRAADRALYRAKEAGRNRVHSAERPGAHADDAGPAETPSNPGA